MKNFSLSKKLLLLGGIIAFSVACQPKSADSTASALQKVTPETPVKKVPSTAPVKKVPSTAPVKG